MKPRLELRLGKSQGALTLPLPDRWTGNVTVSIREGRLSFAGHKLREERHVCAKCGADCICVEITEGRTLEAPE